MSNSPVIVGIDEAGRGALAGPVVAGACILNEEMISNPLIKDSKILSPEKREEAFEWIKENCIFGIGSADATKVDREGILTATESAMQEAVANLAKKKKPSYLIVDGRDKFWFDYPHSAVIKGDTKEACISAASIVAKVTRDKLMIEYSYEFPDYSFEVHKGYGTELHQQCILKHGPCSLHRQTFIKNLLTVSSSLTRTKGTRQ